VQPAVQPPVQPLVLLWVRVLVLLRHSTCQPANAWCSHICLVHYHFTAGLAVPFPYPCAAAALQARSTETKEFLERVQSHRQAAPAAQVRPSALPCPALPCPALPCPALTPCYDAVLVLCRLTDTSCGPLLSPASES
jgi:hypothetical protein